MVERPTYPLQITLPSGRTANILRRPVGRDQRRANQIAGPRASATALGFATYAQVVELDGKPTVMEDFDDVDYEDLVEIGRALGMVPPEGEMDSNFGKAKAGSS